MPNLPATTDAEPNNYPIIAAELHRIADAIAPLRTPGRVAISLTLMMTPKGDTPEQTVAGVDEAALAVLGKPGHAQKSGDTWFHLAQGGDWSLGFSYVAVQAVIPGPPDKRDTELAELRAEVERLRGEKGPGL